MTKYGIYTHDQVKQIIATSKTQLQQMEQGTTSRILKMLNITEEEFIKNEEQALLDYNVLLCSYVTKIHFEPDLRYSQLKREIFAKLAKYPA